MGQRRVKGLQMQVQQSWHMQVSKSRYAVLSVDECGDAAEARVDGVGAGKHAPARQTDGGAGK